uniref:EF-hand domain-containing protein n=2 Tax=Macrostomum lignano TaxID=282301 RepID=A0A1I8G4E2_9PLAT
MSADKDCQTKSEVDLCIFKDIFRRADKNDDGAISWTEFVSYFSDGIVTDDGMRNLFNEIDSHNTNNIDTHELCIYFTERLGSHEPVFESAGSLCRAVSASVKSLAETHARKPPAAQFVDRFLLREMCAHLEAQLQVARLQRLLDRLESRTALVTGRTRIEEAVLDEDEAMILIVRRRLAVQEEQLASFLSAVRKYSSQLEGVTSCLLLSIRQYRSTGSVTLYEFWESLGSWRKFLPSPVSRDLRRALVDCTDAPESTDTMLMPSSWWKNMDH